MLMKMYVTTLLNPVLPYGTSLPATDEVTRRIRTWSNPLIFTTVFITRANNALARQNYERIRPSLFKTTGGNTTISLLDASTVHRFRNQLIHTHILTQPEKLEVPRKKKFIERNPSASTTTIIVIYTPSAWARYDVQNQNTFQLLFEKLTSEFRSGTVENLQKKKIDNGFWKTVSQ